MRVLHTGRPKARESTLPRRPHLRARKLSSFHSLLLIRLHVFLLRFLHSRLRRNLHLSFSWWGRGAPVCAFRRFDHHQKTFHDTLSEESFHTRLSSAGLVYRHFGKQIIRQLVEGSKVPGDVVDMKLYPKVYKVR